MPTQYQHAKAADEHLEAANRALEKDPGWSAVMLFYAALHRLEAAFAVHNKHNRTHAKRDLYLKRYCRDAVQPYMRLKNESLKVRYLKGDLFSMDSKAVKSKLIEDKYEAVVKAADEFRKTGPGKKK